jgi:hypothetical protein
LAPFCWMLLLTGCWRMWKCFRDKFDFLIGGFWCDTVTYERVWGKVVG